jgi:hypothetical protein
MPHRRLGVSQEHQCQGERANGIVSDTLHAYANSRKDDWDDRLPLTVFAINNAASTLGGDLKPFFVDRGASVIARRRQRYPRMCSAVDEEGLQAAGESPAHYAQRMLAMEVTVQELLAAAQVKRKATLNAGRVDSVFKFGDRVLLCIKELLDAADIGKLRPRRDGPFAVITWPSPNAYTLALQREIRCSPTVNFDLLRPYFERAGAEPGPGPESGAGQEVEHVPRGGAAAQPPAGARRHVLLLGSVVRPHIGGRRVAAGGRADTLPGEGGKLRRHGLLPPLGPPGRLGGDAGSAAAHPPGPGAGAPRATSR